MIARTITRLGDRTAMAPPVSDNSIPKGTRVHFDLSRPSGDGHCLPIVCQKDIVSLVIPLFLFCSPGDIARFVMPIVQFSLNRMRSAWSLSNVVQEFFKRVKPKFNSTQGIVFRIGAIRISASVFCRSIRSVFGWIVSPQVCSTRTENVAMRASTASGVCFRKVTDIGGNDIATLATTEPSAFPGEANRCQTTVFPSGSIDKVRMVGKRLKLNLAGIIVLLSHLSKSPRFDGSVRDGTGLQVGVVLHAHILAKIGNHVCNRWVNHFRCPVAHV